MGSNDSVHFAITQDGKYLAMVDGPEVLVYRGDGQPAWKHFCDGVLVGLGFVGAHLAVVDAEGKVVFFSGPDGRKIEEVALDRLCHGAFVSPDGAFCVLSSTGAIMVASNGQQSGVPLQDLATGAFGPDRNSMGLADRHGNFTALDANTGAPWGSLALGAPIAGVAWCYQGFWLITTGQALLRIDGGATQILGRVDLPAMAGPLAVSSDGAIAAVLLAPENIAIVELHTHRYVGDIVFRREVYSLMFGRHAVLGVGFDDADANTVDLLTRATIRTEPHPGRGRNNWNLDMQFEAAPLRGAVTFLRAGGSPIAEFNGYVEPDIVDGGGRSGCKIAALIFFMFFIGLTGCLGFAFLMRFMGFL